MGLDSVGTGAAAREFRGEQVSTDRANAENDLTPPAAFCSLPETPLKWGGVGEGCAPEGCEPAPGTSQGLGASPGAAGVAAREASPLAAARSHGFGGGVPVVRDGSWEKQSAFGREIWPAVSRAHVECCGHQTRGVGALSPADIVLLETAAGVTPRVRQCAVTYSGQVGGLHVAPRIYDLGFKGFKTYKNPTSYCARLRSCSTVTTSIHSHRPRPPPP